MTVCERCGREMETAESCDRKPLLTEDGLKYDPFPFGRGVATDRIPQTPLLSSRTIGRLQQRGFGYLVERMQRGEMRCHDCGVAVGGFHHPYCDAEECPRCHAQLASCDCWAEEEA